jgi:hypothetical protein
VFKFKENYPDEIPEWEIEETENVDSEEDVDEFLTQQVIFSRVEFITKKGLNFHRTFENIIVFEDKYL